MDRTVVHTESKNNGTIGFIINVPFELIPVGFILSLRNRDFSELEFYSKCKSYSESEFYWNILALTNTGVPVAVAWGTSDPIEKLLFITRISVHPYWQSVDCSFIRQIATKIIDYSHQIGMNYTIAITKNSKFFLRKLKGIMKESDNVILEAIGGL